MRFPWRHMLVVVAVMGAFLLAVACDEQEEQQPFTPMDTPTATATAAGAPAVEAPGITTTLSPTDHLAIEDMRLLKATVVDGKGKWEYFGPLVHLEQP